MTLEALAACEATVARLHIRIGALVVEVNELEADVARLEAEDLQPLVDRLRSKIARILKVLDEMVAAEAAD